MDRHKFTREYFAKQILDPTNSPLWILGAAIAFLEYEENPSTCHVRIAQAANKAIMEELQATASDQ